MDMETLSEVTGFTVVGIARPAPYDSSQSISVGDMGGKYRYGAPMQVDAVTGKRVYGYFGPGVTSNGNGRRSEFRQAAEETAPRTSQDEAALVEHAMEESRRETLWR